MTQLKPCISDLDGCVRCTPECVHFRPWWTVHDVQWCTWCTIQVFFWSWWGERDAALALKDCTWCTPAQEYLWPWWIVCVHLYMCTSDDGDEWNMIHVHLYGCTSDLEGLYMTCISTGLNFWHWWITRNAQLSHKARVGQKKYQKKYTISSVLKFASCVCRFQAYHWRRQSMPFKPHKNRTTWNNCSTLRESCYRVWINPLFQNINFGMKKKSRWWDPKFQRFVPCDCSASSVADINAGLQDGVERTFLFFYIDINMKRMKMIGWRQSPQLRFHLAHGCIR